MRRASPVRLIPAVACLALALAALVAPAALQAQSQATTGIIRGTVRGPTGLPISDAAVRVENQDTGLRRSVQTNDRGVFVLSLLPVGTYDVTVESLGQFGTIQRTDVRVGLGESVELELSFQPVEVQELEVTGEGETPLVDPGELTSSQRLNEEVVEGLPNDGRNFLDFTLLTPGVTITQGPDGEEISIAGQRGIFNNVIVDGADFNNPFFGEQRGGQRPAFTFNLDAVEDMVVINAGAPAEYGRTAGGIINVITKSGTNELEGSLHYFGQFDETSSSIPGCTAPAGSEGVCDFPFSQHQFGVTLGGPIVKDRAFFFVAYDQQEGNSTKQLNRDVSLADPGDLDQLQGFLDGAFGGALDDDFGPIQRTNDAKALLAKVDVNLSSSHQASLKYNFTWAEQVNGTFDVDSWGRSANGVEKDRSHAINGALSSQLSSAVSNEFRFQWAREDRPRPYDGPVVPGGNAPPLPGFEDGKPFPDTGMDFNDAFRFGAPFFLPLENAYDTRVQLLDNVTYLRGKHLFKAGVEYNRTSFEQQFLGFANGRYIFDSVDGFIGFVENGRNFVTCSDGSSSTDGTCPAGTSITGPVLLYLQSATVPPVPTSDLGLQSATMHEMAVFLQDTWNPTDNLTINAGIRWEGTLHPNMKQDPSETFYADFLGATREGSGGEGPFEFPSDGRIPDDLNNFQPRFAFTWDVNNDARTVLRGSAGSYFSRIPMLVFAQHRVTNGSFQQTLFRNSALTGVLGPPPTYGELLDTEGALPFGPTIQVPSEDLQLPRTWNFTAEVQQMIGDFVAARLNYQHARTDQLFRFRNLNSPVFGSPWATGIPVDFREPAGPDNPPINGISASPGDGSGLVVAESSAKSRYNAVTFGLGGRGIGGDLLQFDVNYTIAFDKSDDDNERDPFTYRYARADVLGPEFNWSNRDRRHQVNGYVLTRLPGEIVLNNIVRAGTAQPTSESCGPRGAVAGLPANPFAPPAGERASSRVDRLCADGTVLERNTLRKDNAFFEWDIRASKIFPFGDYEIEVIAEAFNVTNTNNFLDTDAELLFNFDGTIRSGLSDPRRFQLGTRFRF